MISIKFEIEEFPSDRSQSYSMVAGVEGTLSIVNDKAVIFKESGILLLELSQSLKSWLDKVDAGDDVDFYYTSMDFEEEPILAFAYSPSKRLYEIDSVWIRSQSFVSQGELVESSKHFLHDLNLTIQEKLGKSGAE